MLVDAVGDEKVDVEGELGTVLLDIGYLEAGLGRAVGEVGVRVGRGAEGGAACGSAEMGLTDVALHCVDGAAGAEYPVLVGLGVEVEEGVGENAAIARRHGVVPSGHYKAGAGEAILEKVGLAAVLKDEPLRGVDGGANVVAVLRVNNFFMMFYF
jgi:hypothetical protein